MCLGLSSVAYGPWSIIHDPLPIVHCLFFAVCGLLGIIHCPPAIVFYPWPMPGGVPLISKCPWSNLWQVFCGGRSMGCGLPPMTNGLSSLMYGLWSVAYGLWAIVHALWILLYGLWSIVYAFWPIGHGLWPRAHGFWP